MIQASDILTREDYESQLAEGFRWLRFRPALEAEFQAFRRRTGLGQLRAILLIGIGFGLSFLLLDYVMDGPGFSTAGTWQRTSIIQPLLLGMLAVSYLPRLQWLLTPLGVLTGLTIAATTLLLATVGESRGFGTPVAGLLTVTFYVYLFLGLSFWPALGTAMTILLASVASYLSHGVPAAAIFYNGIWLLFANLIAATALYNLEHSRRREFLEARILDRLANTDHLTGLANREQFERYFETVWQHCAREQQALAIALLDIDHFKRYNDALGHQAGDDCLLRIAAVLRDATRRPLDLAARYGGEEFVLLMPGCSADHAHLAMSRLISRVEALNIEHPDSPTAPRVTISAGVAEVHPHDTERSPQGALQLADEALYSAKAKGRNRVMMARPDREVSLLTGIFHRTADGRVQQTA
ncbi:MAG: diguanylate cyclase [Gammaproteobacteria bacterium]|nr:MAG: diguanylate cyclase [Gammaproteobacteria bacterium]